MYYKVIRNNEVIDAISSLCYVRHNPRNGMILSCKEEFGQGILSYDCSTIYQLADKNSLGDNYDVVDLVEIDETEFKRLRDLIDGVETEEPESPDDGSQEMPETPEEPEVQEPMTVAEMRTKIKELEEQLAATKILLGVE